MPWFKKLFSKPQESPPMPPWKEIVEIMYDKNLAGFEDKIVEVYYSKDKAKRYVVLKDQRGFFTYQLQAIYPFDADEWKWIHSQESPLPAMWEPFHRDTGKSFFADIEVLHREMKAEPEYKRYF